MTTVSLLSKIFRSSHRLSIKGIAGNSCRRAYAATSVFLKLPQSNFSLGDKQCSHLNLILGINQLRNKLVNSHQGCQSLEFQRNITIFSKRGKRKSVKAVVKRFKRLGSGALKRWRAGKNHNMRKKSTNQKRRLRKPVIVTGRRLRKLNKMLNGW